MENKTVWLCPVTKERKGFLLKCKCVTNSENRMGKLNKKRKHSPSLAECNSKQTSSTCSVVGRTLREKKGETSQLTNNVKRRNAAILRKVRLLFWVSIFPAVTCWNLPTGNSRQESFSSQTISTDFPKPVWIGITNDDNAATILFFKFEYGFRYPMMTSLRAIRIGD